MKLVRRLLPSALLRPEKWRLVFLVGLLLLTLTLPAAADAYNYKY